MKNIITHSKLFCRKNVIVAFVSLFLGFLYMPAQAGQCIVGQVKEVGTWVNPDKNTRGITKAIFAEECKSNPIRRCSGNICSVSYGVKLVYTAKLWGSCSPRDCYWGKVEGRYTSAKWLNFKYDHGFAKRNVWAKTASKNKNWLRLVIDTDFKSKSRKDYRSDTWMKRKK